VSRAGASFAQGRAFGAALGALLGFLAVQLSLASLLSYPGDTAFLLVAGAVAGALLWPTRLRSVLGVLTAGAAVSWLLVAFGPVSAWLADGLPRRDPLRKGDAVFVLSSRMQRDGEPTTEALSRLLHGVGLVAQGQAPRLILSEQPNMRPYAPVAREWLRTLKIEGELLTVGPVTSTRDEAKLVAEMCRLRGWRTLLVVTAPTHSRRAALAFEREGLDVVSSPSVETRFDLETLDRPGERLMAFGALTHERLGLLWYRWKGWVR
jgi:uncharacterized SAM-binding protein YcdF (DUF218 family)